MDFMLTLKFKCQYVPREIYKANIVGSFTREQQICPKSNYL